MILKIKNLEDDWYIIGEIKSIHYFKRIFSGNINEVDADEIIFREGLEGDKYIKAIIEFKWGEQDYTVAFDTIAYLCNDEGKTIEKIVA